MTREQEYGRGDLSSLTASVMRSEKKKLRTARRNKQRQTLAFAELVETAASDSSIAGELVMAALGMGYVGLSQEIRDQMSQTMAHDHITRFLKTTINAPMVKRKGTYAARSDVLAVMSSLSTSSEDLKKHYFQILNGNCDLYKTEDVSTDIESQLAQHWALIAAAPTRKYFDKTGETKFKRNRDLRRNWKNLIDQYIPKIASVFATSYPVVDTSLRLHMSVVAMDSINEMCSDFKEYTEGSEMSLTYTASELHASRHNLINVLHKIIKALNYGSKTGGCKYWSDSVVNRMISVTVYYTCHKPVPIGRIVGAVAAARELISDFILPETVLSGAPSGLRVISGVSSILPYLRMVDTTIQNVSLDLKIDVPTYEICYATIKALTSVQSEYSVLQSYILSGTSCSPYSPTEGEAAVLCYLKSGLNVIVADTDLLDENMQGQQAGNNIVTENKGLYNQVWKAAVASVDQDVVNMMRAEFKRNADRNRAYREAMNRHM